VARKDLSRTVIEGGRYFHNKWARRESHGTARARTREWLDTVLDDPEIAEDTEPTPRKRVHKLFYDKLAPAKRWLASQCGRPWDKVYSELCAQFDTRTVAGAHVVHDHMLDWVSRDGIAGNDYWRHRYFFVDAHGILRRGRYYDRAYRNITSAFEAFRDGRYASNILGTWWWFRGEIDRHGPCTKRYTCKRHHRFLASDQHHLVYFALQPMTRGELRRLEASPDDLRRNTVF
jgi:hypothetical protein